jgi:hypothetical protein
MYAEVEKFLHEERIAVQSDVKILEKECAEFDELRKQFDFVVLKERFTFHVPRIKYSKTRDIQSAK